MEGGGAERVLATVLRHLDRKRFNITLLLIFKTGIFLDSIPEDVKVIGLFTNPKSLTTRFSNHNRHIRDYIWKYRTRHLLDGRHFDVTISFMEGSAAKLHSLLTDLAPRNLSWVHTDILKGRWYDFWFKKQEEKDFYKRINKIAFVSAGTRESFKSIFSTDAELNVIYNPIDTSDIITKGGTQSKSKDEEFTIVSVGRLVHVKRTDRLIHVAGILKKRGLKFKINILGIGQLESELKALSAKLGTDDCVNFVGFTPNPYQWIKQSDVFCLTSETEGFPMVISEALTLNIPIVTTRVTGVVEQLSHGGGLFTSDEPKDIADKLEFLMTHPEALAKLKEETFISARQFNLDNIMAQITDYIEH